MSAIGMLQQSRDSPTTLLLRFASLHSHISTSDEEHIEEESTLYYQNEFDEHRGSTVENREQGHQRVDPSIQLDSEIPQLRGLVLVEPLIIRKRKPAGTTHCRSISATATRDRRASPRSSRFPRHPTSRPAHATLRHRSESPSPRTTESLSPFTTLGNSFLNMATITPDTPSILGIDGSPAADSNLEDSPPRKISLPNSELHLGLGRFTIWDHDISPGPSPPGTPSFSPVKKTSSGGRISSTPTKQALRHAEPMSPSRAGSKAIQVLGKMDVSLKKFESSAPEGPKVKKREHFRPLPSAIVRELDNLFGRTSRSEKSGKQAPSTDKRSKTGKPLPAVPTSIEGRKVGQGKIVTITDSQGQVWQDLEEQAEFAWLLSEQGRGGPPLLLASPSQIRDQVRSPPSPSVPDADQRTPCGSVEDDNILVVDTDNTNSDGDDPFGLPSWRSVYDVPKPHKAPFVLGTKAASTLGVAPGEAFSRGMAFLATDPYSVKYSKGRQTSPEAKHRPSPLQLAGTTGMKPVNTIAVQLEFVASSFSPLGEKGKAVKYNRSVSESAAVTRTSRASAYARPRLAPNPPPRNVSTPVDRLGVIDSGMTSFMNAGTHAEMGGLAASMSKKVGGMFRRAT